MAVRFERAVPEGSPAECQWTPHLQEGEGDLLLCERVVSLLFSACRKL